MRIRARIRTRIRKWTLHTKFVIFDKLGKISYEFARIREGYVTNGLYCNLMTKFYYKQVTKVLSSPKSICEVICFSFFHLTDLHEIFITPKPKIMQIPFNS